MFDPMCPVCSTCDVYLGPCTYCIALAKARADEREKAAQRVGAFLFGSPFTIDGLIEQAVAAARGGEDNE